LNQPNHNNKQIAILQVLNLFLGVLGSIVASYILTLLNGINLITIVSIILLTIIVLVFSILISIKQTMPLQIKKTSYWILVVIVLSLVVPATVQAWLNAKPPTHYFVIDATDNMNPFFDEMRTNIQAFVLRTASHKNGFGIRIYGGKTYSSDTIASQQCEDNTQQILQPSIYSDASNTINEKLESIEPIDNGSLIIAVQSTIDHDLANYDEPVNLIIVTTAAYTECAHITSGFKNLLMSEINALRERVSLNVSIYSIGKLTFQSAEILNNYARDFGGCHLNISNPNELSQAMEINGSYCSSYPVIEPPPTSTP
jgi:hypothetical protein